MRPGPLLAAIAARAGAPLRARTSSTHRAEVDEVGAGGDFGDDAAEGGVGGELAEDGFSQDGAVGGEHGGGGFVAGGLDPQNGAGYGLHCPFLAEADLLGQPDARCFAQS